MVIGYARVSTEDQDTAAQVVALKATGCERIFREKASGERWNQPQLPNSTRLSIRSPRLQRGCHATALSEETGLSRRDGPCSVLG